MNPSNPRKYGARAGYCKSEIESIDEEDSIEMPVLPQLCKDDSGAHPFM